MHRCRRCGYRIAESEYEKYNSMCEECHTLIDSLDGGAKSTSLEERVNECLETIYILQDVLSNDYFRNGSLTNSVAETLNHLGQIVGIIQLNMDLTDFRNLETRDQAIFIGNTMLDYFQTTVVLLAKLSGHLETTIEMCKHSKFKLQPDIDFLSDVHKTIEKALPLFTMALYDWYGEK